MNQQLPIENQFISILVDQLNEENVLGTIQNSEEVIGNLSARLQDFGSSRELDQWIPEPEKKRLTKHRPLFPSIMDLKRDMSLKSWFLG